MSLSVRGFERPYHTEPYPDALLIVTLPAPQADADVDSIADRPSKTQRKKAMHDLQSLGDALATMPDERLSRIDLPERILEAVLAYKRTKSHEGRRRQMQFIGKLMRGADEGPIREAVAAYQLGIARESLDLHRAEAWRAQLLAEDGALTTWMQTWPTTELSRLRTLIRQARKDAAAHPEQRGGRAYREIFQFIKETMRQDDPSAAANTKDWVPPTT